MKAMIFIRGVNSDFKRQVVSTVLNSLNTDFTNLMATRVSMIDYPEIKDTIIIDKICKQQVINLLSDQNAPPYIIIDNETLIDKHWVSYLNLDEFTTTPFTPIGIDVYTNSENIITERDKGKNNLQYEYQDLFIAYMYKYFAINSFEELNNLVTGFKPQNK